MAQLPPPGHRKEFEIAIICALGKERDAVEALLDEEYETNGFSYGKAIGDHNAYTTGRISNHYVVLVYMPGMGKASSAAVASSIRTSFEGIKISIIVGICGGTPRTADGTEILLGDVIIGETVIQIDFGRRYPNKFTRNDALEDNLGRANPEIRSFLGRLSGQLVRRRLKDKTTSYSAELCKKDGFHKFTYPGAENDKLYPPYYRHKHQTPNSCVVCGNCQNQEDEVCETALNSSCKELGCDERQLLPRYRVQRAKGLEPDGSIITDAAVVGDARKPSIHFGRIASGDGIMKSGQHRDEIVAREKVIAFEMEGAGAWDYLPTVVIKSVCDYADSHKNKAWQEYAAANAAACTKAFLEEWRSTVRLSEGLRRGHQSSQSHDIYEETDPERSQPQHTCITPGGSEFDHQTVKLLRAASPVKGIVPHNDVSPAGLVYPRQPNKSPIKVESNTTLVSRVPQNRAAAELLRQNKFDLEDKCLDKVKALLWAAKSGHEEAVQLLLENGADATAKDEDGYTALHEAARNGNEAVVRLLLENGADITAKNKDGRTALHEAAFNGRKVVVQLLLKKGSDVNARNQVGATPLHVAAWNGNEAEVQLLLENGADITAENKDGCTALFAAAFNKHKAVVQLLVKKGSDISARNQEGVTALHGAAWTGNKAAVQLLLEIGADTTLKTRKGNTALQLAAMQGHLAVVQLLLENGVDIAVKGVNGMTALQLAAIKGHAAVVRLLLENGADVAGTALFGLSALYLAAKDGHEAVVRLLLEKGADATSTGMYGMTALHFAVKGGHSAVAEVLLERGADVNAQIADGETALHWAAQSGNLAMVLLLLEKGADVAARDKDGWTALHQAASNGHFGVVVQLLEKGADATAKNKDERTALDLATLNGHDDVVESLELAKLPTRKPVVQNGPNRTAQNQPVSWSTLFRDLGLPDVPERPPRLTSSGTLNAARQDRLARLGIGSSEIGSWRGPEIDSWRSPEIGSRRGPKIFRRESWKGWFNW